MPTCRFITYLYVMNSCSSKLICFGTLWIPHPTFITPFTVHVQKIAIYLCPYLFHDGRCALFGTNMTFICPWGTFKNNFPTCIDIQICQTIIASLSAFCKCIFVFVLIKFVIIKGQSFALLDNPCWAKDFQ